MSATSTALADRVGISSITFRFRPLDEALRLIEQTGATEIDLGAIPAVTDHVPVPFTRSSQQYVDLLASFGLRSGAVNADVGDINDPALTKDALAAIAVPLIDLAAATGGALIVPCGRASWEPIVDEAADLDLIAENLRFLGDLCRAKGVRLLVEVLHHKRYIHDVVRAEELLARVGSDVFGLLFDVSHIVASGDDPVAWAALRTDRVERVHLRDAVPGNLNVGIGRGDTDFGAVIRQLESHGFAGTYILELETHDVQEDEREADALRSRNEIVRLLETAGTTEGSATHEPRRDHELTARITAVEAAAYQIRMGVLEQGEAQGEGYVGQALDSADIFSVVYTDQMRFRPADPTWEDRDRFLLSTGHYALGLYATLAEAGVIPREELITYACDGSRLPMSAMSTYTPGTEISGGSLGHGLGLGVGMALGLRHQQRDTQKVFTFFSDGELDEGSTWEAAMSAGHFQLGNLIGMVDMNGLQADGKTSTVLSNEPQEDRWAAFGWHVQRVDGNDVPALIAAFDEAAELAEQSGPVGKPHIIICDTRLGKGVPLLEGREKLHFMKIAADEWGPCKEQLTAGYQGKDAR